MKKDLLKIFNFLHAVENFKSTLRVPKTKTGRQESSAEHSWRVSLMVFIIAEELNLDIDIFKAIKLAIVHDLAECITGDYPSHYVYYNKGLKLEKERKEKKAMKSLMKMLPEKSGKVVYNLWNEYEEQKTKEAKYIKALERIETLTQFIETNPITYEAVEYTAIYADKSVEKFPELKGMLSIIKEELKKAYTEAGIPWKEEYKFKK